MKMHSISRIVRGWALVLSAAVAVSAIADEVAGVRLPCEPVMSAGNVKLLSQTFAGRYQSTYSPAAPVEFDIGTPRTITGVSFLVSSGSWSLNNMQKTFMIEASLDGETYETIYEKNSHTLERSGDYDTFAVASDRQGPYRYFRASANDSALPKSNYVALYLNDLRVVSTELSIDGVEPNVWSDRSTVSQPGTNEVTFAAKVLASPNGNATVYAAYALKDFGLSLADWQAKGTVAELGSCAAGATVSASVADIAPGNYIVRYFAVCGDDTYAWPLRYEMTTDSRAYLATMLALDTKVGNKNNPAARQNNLYNENIATTDYVSMKKATDDFVVFSLADLPADEVVGSLRIWNNYGYRMCAIGMQVEVSFDTADLMTDSTEFQTTALGRVVRTRASFPDMTWVTAGSFTNAAETIPYVAFVDDVTKPAVAKEIPLDQSVMRSKPTYLRVSWRSESNELWPTELELRAMKLPPAPEGEAQIDEVGATFARVSGKVDTCGAGGGNAAIRFVATPTAGGETVVSVISSSVASGGTFAGTATGLKGETQYDWQVIASNATAGAVLASGTFTTPKGAASVVPIVSFVSATANADGTMTISYNLSDAGEGYEVADVYVRYGTDPLDLSGEKLIAEDALGEGTVDVEGLPPGATLYLALVAKNAGGKVSEVTEQKSCETVGPCGLTSVAMRPEGCSGVTVAGKLSPRGLGDAQVYFDYVSELSAETNSVLAGTVASAAAADFSFTATLPRLDCVTGMVRVVNAFGGVSWTVVSEAAVVPFGVRLPCQPTLTSTAKETAKTFSGVYAANYGPQATVYFDIGAPSKITGVSFMVSDRPDYILAQTKKTFKIEASLDGETYETIFANANRDFTIGGTYMSYAADADHRGPYRYFRVEARDAQVRPQPLQLMMCDVRVLGTGLAVTGNRPVFWEHDLEASQTNEVTFSGKLLSAATGSAHVYAVCAKSDCGDALAAWQANGQVFDLGTVNEGAEFSAVRAVPAGAYHCRYYAVTDDDTSFSPERFTFSSGTKSHIPSKIYVSGDAAESIKKIYDGDVSSFAWYNATVPQIVLPLDEIPAGYRLASVRVWTRPGYASNHYDISADVSSDAVDLDEVSTEVQTKNDRTVRGVTSWPEMTWTAAGGFTEIADAIDYARNEVQGVEFLVPSSAAKGSPKFLRINANQATLTLAEIELRVVPEAGFTVIVR